MFDMIVMVEAKSKVDESSFTGNNLKLESVWFVQKDND